MENYNEKNMKKKYFSCSGAVSRLCSLFILLASLLVLPKAHAAIGDTFTIDQLQYTVYTEDKASQTGTVSVQAESTNISGDITIPTSVANGGINYSVILIPTSAFQYCSSLTSIIIPDGVTSIGGSAFSGCASLTNVTIGEGVTSIGFQAFDGCRSLISIVIPDSVTEIDEYAFSWCSSLTSIVIPDGITSIGGMTFTECSSLTSIVIPGSVTYVGYNAFRYCRSLTNIVIPKSVTHISNSAFSGCSNLTGVYFEGNAPSVGDSPFVAPVVIYYRPGTTGWTNPWSERPTTLWIESPEITKQPQSLAVMEGDSVTFNVIAEGTEPLSYQWYKEGTLLEGAATASYTIESVSAEDLGNYTVIVSNELGEVTSDIAVLSYLTSPTITMPPISLTVDAWSQAVFQVEALGAESYQWYRNDIPISGATGAFYTIDSAKGIDVGTYKVVITNRAGTATGSATLSLTQPYRATGTVQVVDGSVVGLTVTDGGWGYTREPKIRIKDETGKGATGHCIIENGVVTQIIIDNPGSNYSGEATILIGSPFSNTSLDIAVSEVKVKMHLVLGMEYQLWSSVDCINWEQVGESFIAEEEEMDLRFQVEDYGRFFKLQEI